MTSYRINEFNCLDLACNRFLETDSFNFTMSGILLGGPAQERLWNVDFSPNIYIKLRDMRLVNKILKADPKAKIMYEEALIDIIHFSSSKNGKLFTAEFTYENGRAVKVVRKWH